MTDAMGALSVVDRGLGSRQKPVGLQVLRFSDPQTSKRKTVSTSNFEP